jgi:hypothetical protein
MAPPPPAPGVVTEENLSPYGKLFDGPRAACDAGGPWRQAIDARGLPGSVLSEGFSGMGVPEFCP